MAPYLRDIVPPKCGKCNKRLAKVDLVQGINVLGSFCRPCGDAALKTVKTKRGIITLGVSLINERRRSRF